MAVPVLNSSSYPVGVLVILRDNGGPLSPRREYYERVEMEINEEEEVDQDGFLRSFQERDSELANILTSHACVAVGSARAAESAASKIFVVRVCGSSLPFPLTPSLSLTLLLTHSLIHSLTHSPPLLLPPSLTHSHPHFLPLSLPPYPLPPSLLPFIHSSAALKREKTVNDMVSMATACQEPIRDSPDFIEKLTRLLGDVVSADWWVVP